MTIPFFQVDAFTQDPFKGNPAAICPLETWIDEGTMQAIAMENNLSETAFFIPIADGFEIRWFTPTKEVDLCGHATLASAYVIFNFLNYTHDNIRFESKSGSLYVRKENDRIVMDFPSEPPVRCETPTPIQQAFDISPIEVLKSVDYIVVFDEGIDLRTLKPKLEYLKELDLRGVCITNKGKEVDVYSRFFAPNYGIDEDSVTGSAYTQLTPYWVNKLNKTDLSSKQLSSRGGELRCALRGDRVEISGHAVCCIKGELQLPSSF